MSEDIQRVLVWPAVIRILHLMMAMTVMILLVTGLLMHSSMILNEQLYQHLLQVWHLPSGHVLAAVLSVRVMLLVTRKDVAGWRALIPENLDGVVNTATFYLSMARMNLPGYFAHNPLWKILYLLWFVLLVVQVITGLLLESSWLRSVFRTDSSTALYQHQFLLEPLTIIVIAHSITALLHDWKSPASEISAMVHGYKFFSFERKQQSTELNSSVTVNIDGLMKTAKPQKSRWPTDDKN